MLHNMKSASRIFNFNASSVEIVFFSLWCAHIDIPNLGNLSKGSASERSALQNDCAAPRSLVRPSYPTCLIYVS
jgi:hypothetical protein